MGVPKRLEVHLSALERTADEFRSISMEAISSAGCPPAWHTTESEAHDEQLELLRACEDLQVDIAVLLESALMTAQQALAEYKKMHCRLELLVTEYEPICRSELESPEIVFPPLALQEGSQQMADASLPKQAVNWAVDFSQLVGSAD